METPLSVDVVINNFNYGRFLSAAIDSVLTQTRSAAAVIVVDDGSTDDSRDVIALYGERIVPVLKRNGGQASAMNAGFAKSSGDIVMFLDSDDLLRPEAVQLVSAAMEADRSLSKVQFRMEVIDANGRKTGETKPPPHYPLPSGDLRRLELTVPFDLPWLPTSANAFDARVLRRIFPIPEPEYAKGADWYLKHLAALFGTVRSLNEVGAYYRVHGLNLYEPAAATMELGQLRDTIVLNSATRRHIERVADELRLERPGVGMHSAADVANRMISIRMAARAHPIASDTRLRLLWAGGRAAMRRTDVSPVMRLLFIAWFMAAATAPRRVVPWLGEAFLFPRRRLALTNAVLGALHRP